MSSEVLFCHECGSPMFIDDVGVSYHLLVGGRAGRVDDVDYDTDRDHVAIPDGDGVNL